MSYPTWKVVLGGAVAGLVVTAGWVYYRFMDTPLTIPHAQTASAREFTLDGKTIPGAHVRVNGQPVFVKPDGNFSVVYNFDLMFTGTKIFEVVADTALRRETIGRVVVERTLPTLTLTAATSSRVTRERSVVISGRTQPGSSLRVNGELVSLSADGSYIYIHRFPAGFQGDVLISVSAEQDGYGPVSTTVSVTRKASESEIRQEFAAGALRTFPYREVLKNASAYGGTKVVVWGRVLQIQESRGSTFMLVYVTPRSYGLWDDIIAVEYEGTTNFLNGNQVEIYGVIQGDIYSYQTNGGWTNRVPQVRAASFGDKYYQ
jgi:RNase P/RNase MRP subunit p29